jgi:hypothetical protein
MAVAAVLIAVSIVNAVGVANSCAACGEKMTLIYVMESDRVSTLVIKMGWITLSGEPASAI